MKYYKTKKVTYNNITFDSKLEEYFYKLLEINNLVDKVTLQKSFELQPSFKYFKRTIRPITYEADFVFEDKKIIVETKGKLEEKARLKHKMFKYKYRDYQFFMPRNQKDCVEVIKQIKEIYGKS
jgi:hypothetical protein